MTDRPNALAVKMRPYHGYVEPPDQTVRSGVAWEGQAQTFFTATLDQAISFGNIGDFDRVVVWARGHDFVGRDGGTLVFVPSSKAYGYVGIDPSECKTERHRRAMIEAEFWVPTTPLD